MEDNLVALQVFLASPGDVVEERALARRVIEEVDRSIARRLGFALEAVAWETHGRPGVGADTQEVISRQIRPRDVFVGVMWSRLGTPTERAESGTVEEFEQALTLHRAGHAIELLFYFCTRNVPRGAAEQVPKVLAFQRRTAEEGVYSREYQEPLEFADLLRGHLSELLFEWSPTTARPELTPNVENTGRAALLQFAAAAEARAHDALGQLTALASVIGQIERRCTLPAMDGWPATDQCAVADRTVYSLLAPTHRLATLVVKLRDHLNDLDGLLGSVLGESARIGTDANSARYLREQTAEITARLAELSTRISVQRQVLQARAEAQSQEWLKIANALDEPSALLAGGIELAESWRSE